MRENFLIEAGGAGSLEKWRLLTMRRVPAAEVVLPPATGSHSRCFLVLTSSPSPALVNRRLSEHGYVHSLTYHLRLLSHYHGELSSCSCDKTPMAPKAENMDCWSFSSKKFATPPCKSFFWKAVESARFWRESWVELLSWERGFPWKWLKSFCFYFS